MICQRLPPFSMLTVISHPARKKGPMGIRTLPAAGKVRRIRKWIRGFSAVSVREEEGAALLGGKLPEGLAFAPAEGDAGTGMTATNAVAPRTGNVSAGTSIFAMVVLEKGLSKP